jgi:dihydrofolate reductase
MARLIYSAITSLDGYVADESGNFDWAEPDEAVHAFVNDLERPVGTYLYGRGMYEVMRAWETVDVSDQPPVIQDFAEIWQGAEKIVFSRTMETASTARTRIERDFDAETIRQLKAGAGARHQHRRSAPCRAGDQGRIGRRDPPLPRADRGRRRQTVPPRQDPPEARTA